jgi:hypothetical protein
MGRIAIRKVIYHGEKYHYESPRLEDGPVIIEGSNGAGKTTFADLVYYGLGGSVAQFKRTGRTKHKEVTSDTGNYVQLITQIGSNFYSLRRFIGENEIGVLELGEGENEHEPFIYPLRRRGDVKTFSDWILERLSIEPITLWQGNRSWRLAFNDLMRLI